MLEIGISISKEARNWEVEGIKNRVYDVISAIRIIYDILNHSIELLLKEEKSCAEWQIHFRGERMEFPCLKILRSKSSCCPNFIPFRLGRERGSLKSGGGGWKKGIPRRNFIGGEGEDRCMLAMHRRLFLSTFRPSVLTFSRHILTHHSSPNVPRHRPTLFPIHAS